jgi:hypothetical protein
MQIFPSGRKRPENITGKFQGKPLIYGISSAAHSKQIQ